MSGHVIYACSCLNIKIHLSSKYSLNNHASERQQYWYEQENPLIEGWKVELGMGGIVIAYNSLIETKTDQQWMTVSCLNCDTEKVYSTHTKIANTQNTTSALQSDDFVIIHKNTLFGSEIDEVRQDDQFSEIFDIKLSNIPSSTNIDNNNNNLDVPEHLTAQHQQVYQVLEKALDKMRLDSEVRIEQWKKVEMERLEEQTKIARQQSNQLWKRVLQANLENPHQFYRKSSVGLVSIATSNLVTPSSIENSNQSSTTPSEIFSDNNKQSENITETSSATEAENITSISSSLKMENNTQSGSLKKSHVVRFKENIDQSKSNNPSGSYRRPSFSLDESAITNSLGKQLQESQATVENNITLELNKTGNKNINNNEDEVEDEFDEEEEDMFDLDEEILSENGMEDNDIEVHEQQPEEESNTIVNNAPETSASPIPSPSPKPSSIKENKDRRSSWIKKKKTTGKYIDVDENDEESQITDDHNHIDETKELSCSISKYATSVPINIHAPMHTLISPNNNSNVVEPANEDPTNIFDDDNDKLLDSDIYFGSKPPTLTSHSFATMTTTTIAENINNIRNNDSKKTFTNYDLSYNDRPTSRLLPDYNAGRRKSVATMSGRQPQLDALIEKSSLDTRSMKRL